MRYSALIALVALLVACSQPAPPAPAAAPGPAESEITGPLLVAHLRMLSSDLFEGRAPATRGGELAAEYLATQMAALGLQPAGDNGTFFQQVPIVESTVDRTFTLSVPGTTWLFRTPSVRACRSRAT
jgi:hypothetical protein